MLNHFVGSLVAVALLSGAAPQQQQSNPQTLPYRPFRPYPFNMQPKATPTPTTPKLPSPKGGITVPNRNPVPTQPNPSFVPSPPRLEPDAGLASWTRLSPAAAGLTFYMPSAPTETSRSIRSGERGLDMVEF